MEKIYLFVIGIGIILASGFLSLILPERLKSWAVALGTGCGACFLIIPSLSILLLNTQPAQACIILSYPVGAVNLLVDRLSAFFIIVIAAMSFLGTMYAIGYMRPYYGKGRTVTSHFFLLTILIASMLSVTIVQNALAFLIVWEIMSLSSFFLVAFENEREDVYQAAINYLIAMHVGVLFLMVGFLMTGHNAASFDFAAFSQVFAGNPGLTNLVFVLLFIGFGTKAGFVPLHTWLPKAHPAAPSHISGLMSGIMIKTGIYGILRIILLIKNPGLAIGYFVLVISVVSGILGVAYAIAQHNIKRLLAYHSVENIGIIGIGIGIGMLGLAYQNPMLALLGFAGGILHVLNHSIFKTLLFFSCGSVYQQTHLLNIEKLGGIIRYMLFSSIAFLVGSIAISGLPPFNGFVSEFFIYWGMLKGIQGNQTLLALFMVISFASLAFIGAMALLCFTKVFSVVFLGSPRTEYHETPHECSKSMQAAMWVQMILILIIGLFPQYAFAFVSQVAQDFVGMETQTGVLAPYLNILSRLSLGLLIFIVLSAGILIVRKSLLHNKTVRQYKTWDCGYQNGNSRMQYTASSFAAPFLTVFRTLFHWEEHLEQPKGVFPDSSHFESHAHDRFEHGLINPLIDGIQRFLNAFSWIQNGSTQQYILYGLIFLISIIIWILAV